MPAQPVFWFGTAIVVGDAAAVNIATLVSSATYQDFPFLGQTGACVSLNFIADKDIIVGDNAGITEDPTDGGGAVLSGGTSFVDSGTGATGNVIPLSHIFIFSESTDATLTIYVRSLP